MSGAIFERAGEEELNNECKKMTDCKVGQAFLTNGYNLPAKHIIHAVGPSSKEKTDKKDSEELLKAIRMSLTLALDNNIKSLVKLYNKILL